ncbi:MAG: thioredoxin family protein [Arenicella sp.]
MGKQRKTTRKYSPKPISKIALLKLSGIALLLFAIASFAMVKSEQKSKIEHDLSIIGKGTPALVQIHDPKCQLCRRLQRVVGNVKGDFEGKVLFRTAVITSEKGRKFAARYNVPHVTLLLFDKRGKHVDTLRGVSSKQEVHEALSKISQ